jgi:hypothetical protein
MEETGQIFGPLSQPRFFAGPFAVGHYERNEMAIHHSGAQNQEKMRPISIFSHNRCVGRTGTAMTESNYADVLKSDVSPDYSCLA